MKLYEVRRPEPWNEPGVVVDRLELTQEQAKEVEAVLQEHPGLILVPVCAPTFRRLTGEYALP